MGRAVLGLDFGSGTLKLVQCESRSITRFAEEPMPDQLVKGVDIISPEAMAAFLKETVKKHKITAKQVAVVIPAGKAFVLRTEIPPMNESQLKINLPYEFRDFITEDRDKYFYDYAVVKKITKDDGQLEKMQLVAAAIEKEYIYHYRDICRWAGLKLVTAVPAELALINVIRNYESDHEETIGAERCIVDMGHTQFRSFFYTGDEFKAITTSDRGGMEIDSIIADALGVDIHIARSHKETNMQNEVDNENVHSFINDKLRELQRSINFYNYNNPDSELKDIWLAGGMSRIHILEAEASEVFGDQVKLHSIKELMVTPEGISDAASIFAYGAALQ